MAWLKRKLKLDDGREVEVECGEGICFRSYFTSGQQGARCPGLSSGGGTSRAYPCRHFGSTLLDGYRPAACKRAEARARGGA